MTKQSAARARIGHGFDIHAFKTGEKVTIGGVDIPHAQGIDAHSDGDVAIHALCDALLGALALGDIGHFFPPGEMRWKDADSRVLLRTVMEKVHALGYVLGNADITVICEAPKLAPHLALMRERLSKDLDIDAASVSIKATTNEKLDAIGQRQGLAAHAVVLLWPA
jgi:2-C-methyl-D-erythritol 2,4-cyclodiphosphate synthase